ncbi:MAG: RsmB/NOP family class I SAM-dependent RNA methyltransferase, partial [Pseudomonadota bacterium]
LPADAQMERYFRAHREMGVRDRGQVAETVYGVLRHRRELAHIAGAEDAAPQDLIYAWMIRQGISARALDAAGADGDLVSLVARARQLDEAALPFAVRADLPDWLAQALRDQLGDTEALALASALKAPAPVDLRANTIKIKREELRTRLAAEGFATELTPYSPVGLRRATREPLFHTAAFKEGLFEIQDEGSQLLSLLVEPRRHEMVVDFCAGAGGKTLHLGALMANTGTVYAFDTQAKRLEKLKPRLQRSGLQNVRSVVIAHENDERVRRLHGKIDRVLVDAPCSGTGTLRRNPDIKWRAIDLASLAEAQARILAAASELLKVGGRLVYATCSLLREENDAVVEAFLASHPGFTPLAAQELLAHRDVTVPMHDAALRLAPHTHATDGFFAMAFERGA